MIAQYLDDLHPDRYALYPQHVADRARARWLEEYADTRLADVVVWGVFQRAVLEPGIWGKPRDVEAIGRVVREELPDVLDYLEAQVPAAGFLFEGAGIGVADIALAAPFRNPGFARQRVDAERWPRTAAFIDRVLSHPALSHLQPYEERQVRTPIAEQRAMLAAMGAPLSESSWAAPAPRRRPMTR